MNNYISTPNGELYHYGVKGMKWGVRRNIGVKARAAGIYGHDIKVIGKRAKRLEKKARKNGLTNKNSEKLQKYKNSVAAMTNIRNVLIKDLNPKDIRRGQNVATVRRIMLYTIRPRLARSVERRDVAKAFDILQRESNKQ